MFVYSFHQLLKNLQIKFVHLQKHRIIIRQKWWEANSEFDFVQFWISIFFEFYSFVLKKIYRLNVFLPLNLKLAYIHGPLSICQPKKACNLTGCILLNNYPFTHLFAVFLRSDFRYTFHIRSLYLNFDLNMYDRPLFHYQLKVT